MELKAAQFEVDEWIKNIGVRYFNELTNLTILMEEVGELARIGARVYGEQSFKLKEDQLNALDHWKEELGDVLFVLICLANQTEVDLEKCFKENLIKKSNRDKIRHTSNKKLKN